MNDACKTSAQILWDYMHLNQKLQTADLLLVLGSHDLSVADHAASLFHDGYAKMVVISGGIAHRDDWLQTGWDATEAEVFSQRMEERGVPIQHILLEKEAKNTGENFLFTKKLLIKMGEKVRSVIAVTKPYMERRAYATGKVQWPDIELFLTSPTCTFEQYISGDIDEDVVMNVMVGDLQRIIEYPKKGFQIPQLVPKHVLEAFEHLVACGYNKRLLNQPDEE